MDRAAALSVRLRRRPHTLAASVRPARVTPRAPRASRAGAGAWTQTPRPRARPGRTTACSAHVAHRASARQSCPHARVRPPPWLHLRPPIVLVTHPLDTPRRCWSAASLTWTPSSSTPCSPRRTSISSAPFSTSKRCRPGRGAAASYRCAPTAARHAPCSPRTRAGQVHETRTAEVAAAAAAPAAEPASAARAEPAPPPWWSLAEAARSVTGGEGSISHEMLSHTDAVLARAPADPRPRAAPAGHQRNFGSAAAALSCRGCGGGADFSAVARRKTAARKGRRAARAGGAGALTRRASHLQRRRRRDVRRDARDACRATQ